MIQIPSSRLAGLAGKIDKKNRLKHENRSWRSRAHLGRIKGADRERRRGEDVMGQSDSRGCEVGPGKL